ncbi:Uncharacterized protein dnl_11860 [Desulfonema limicola]|uniref:Uncharacterized protein n=1 Tax=Desulfonema limicola TaxID=45656 RepID=A0A975B523_9BACT|nr:hypothetical protein [Desulfonema limicola]QTA78938.1 Uncharacterized protein dnl_11860 [Desulfonema limicola]
MERQKPLTNLQLEVLKLYALDLTEDELTDVKNVLARHFADRLSKRVNHIWQQKGLTPEDMEKWLNDENQSEQVSPYHKMRIKSQKFQNI